MRRSTELTHQSVALFACILLSVVYEMPVSLFQKTARLFHPCQSPGFITAASMLRRAQLYGRRLVGGAAPKPAAVGMPAWALLRLAVCQPAMLQLLWRGGAAAFTPPAGRLASPPGGSIGTPAGCCCCRGSSSTQASCRSASPSAASESRRGCLHAAAAAVGPG